MFFLFIFWHSFYIFKKRAYSLSKIHLLVTKKFSPIYPFPTFCQEGAMYGFLLEHVDFPASIPTQNTYLLLAAFDILVIVQNQHKRSLRSHKFEFSLSSQFFDKFVKFLLFLRLPSSFVRNVLFV